MVSEDTVELPRPIAETVRRPRRSSVRIRILGWYVALLAISLVAAVLVQRTFLLAQVRADAVAALDQEFEEFQQLVGGIDPNTGEPFGPDISAIFDTHLAQNVPLEGEGLITYLNGEVYKTDLTGARIAVLDSAGAWGALTDSSRRVLHDYELGEIHFLAVPIGVGEPESGVFVVAVIMGNRLAAVDDAIRLGVIVYGSIFLLASALAWIAAGRILQPLTDLTETAMSISDTDLSRRIEVEGDDEIAELGTTFNSMLDRLDEAFASQRRFVDDAGHELRTPITIIRGNLEVMGDDAEERRETVALVTDELDRMSRIVDDLLDLAKAEQPDFIQLGPIDLAEFTTDLAIKAASLDEREWVVDEAADVVVDVDRHRLNQAMMNLIRNAAEHSPPGTRVRIGSKVDWRGTIRMWVRDEGESIPVEERARIFDRFSRVSTDRRKTEGAGLGLAIVSAIAEAHGGRVEVDAPRRGGNVFTIIIPSQARGG